MLNTLIKITLAILVFLSQQVLAKNYLVGFAQDTLANDWRLSQVMAVKAELEKHKNIQFVYTDGKGSTSLQASHIEDLVNNKKIDVLITSLGHTVFIECTCESLHDIFVNIAVIVIPRVGSKWG